MSEKNPFIKKANVETEYTPQQIQELIKCSSDPVYFMRNYASVQHPTKGRMNFDLYSYQEEMVGNYENHRLNILLTARQMGKTVTSAIYLLWYAMFHFDKIVLIAAHKNDHAMEIIDRIRYCYEELPDWLKPGVNYYNKHSLEFDNGSKIVSQATTENTGRGLSISLLYLDEFAFIQPRIQTGFWTSIFPTLSTGGKVIISSTPNGDSDLFASLWRGAMSGTNGFHPFEVKWDKHPDRDAKFKLDMLGALGELKWKQEHECEFVSSDPLLLNSVVLQQLRPSMHKFEDHGFKFWGDVNNNSTYYVGVDISNGIGNDFSTIQVVEFPSMQQFAEFKSNSVNPQQLYGKIKWILKYLTKPNQRNQAPEVYWSYENNGVGASITALYVNDETFPEVTLISDNNRYGIATTSKSKILACLELKRMVEKNTHGLVVNSDRLLFELKNFVSNGKNSYAAKSGATDDLVSAMLIVMQLMQRTATYEQAMFDAMYDYDSINYDVDEEGELTQSDDQFGADPLPMVF